MSTEPHHGVVTVLVGATQLDIDFDACFDAGLLDIDDAVTSGEMIAAVRQAIRRNNSLLDTNGNLVLVTGPVHAIITKGGQ